MADEIDNELATELRKALKQPRNFALIARGVEPLKLFVQKKPLKLSELKTAKSELGGATGRTRTGDLRFTKPLLYQLS